MDRADTCEQACKEAKRRATKAKEEHSDLSKEASQVEMELSKASEQLVTTTQKQEEKEKALVAAELEVHTFNRRVQGLDGDLEQCEDKLLLATHKLDKAATAVDENDRMRKVLEN